MGHRMEGSGEEITEKNKARKYPDSQLYKIEPK
jgi:hypothetical protein